MSHQMQSRSPVRRAASGMARIIGASLRYTGSALSALGQVAARRVSLVPAYLANLLWLLGTQFFDLATKGYGGNAAVYSCLRLLSQSVPEPPLIAYARVVRAHDEAGASGAGPGKQLPYTETPLGYDHPLSRLIRQPNDLMTEYAFWELTTLHLGVTGRATWFKERDNAGRIRALWPLRPDRVGPVYSTSETPGEQVISGWSYLVPGTTHYAFLARADVVAFILPNPAGDSGGIVEGLGPLQVLASEVGADNAATAFVGNLVSNYAMPGGLLQTKNAITSREDLELIKAAFADQYGAARQGKVGVLDAESTWQAASFTLRDLEFPNLRDVAESRIAAAFGTPAILVGLRVGLMAGIRATISEQREYFAETTLSNYWRRYSDVFSLEVASEFGAGYICRFDISVVKALQAQAKATIDKIADGFAKGAVTVNEYRQHVLNLPARKDGDVRILPRGVVEIGEATQAEDVLPAGTTVSPSGGAPDANAQPNQGTPLGQSTTPLDAVDTQRVAAANGKQAA